MAANKHKLYRDRTPFAALEEFLERVARTGAEPDGEAAPTWVTHPQLSM